MRGAARSHKPRQASGNACHESQLASLGDGRSAGGFLQERRCNFFFLVPAGRSAQNKYVTHFVSQKARATATTKSWPRVAILFEKLASQFACESEAQQELQEPWAHKARLPNQHFFFQGGVHKKSPFHKSLGSKSVPHHDEGHEGGQKRKSRPAVQGRAAQQEALHAQEGWQR